MQYQANEYNSAVSAIVRRVIRSGRGPASVKRYVDQQRRKLRQESITSEDAVRQITHQLVAKLNEQRAKGAETYHQALMTIG